ncbi:MAG TPA: M48 family metallopeptidase [Vicinamibacterales bacterium]|nr:M48 family metallopeptidase [Vicinamibacterales bacterium]
MNEDKATRYHRLQRRLRVLAALWTGLLLAGLVWSGANLPLGALAESIAAQVSADRWLPTTTVLAYVLLLSLLHEAVALPLAFYSGYVVERRYALSNETIGSWAVDQAKSFGIGVLLAGAAASLVYALIRVFPNWWWAAAGGLFALCIIGLTHLAPVLILPLFYRVKPLERDTLRARLLALADRAGAQVLGAYEWGLAEKTTRANAALAGVGGTRRILVSDTMLAEYSDEEIEVVLAHELAHHVHGDIWKGIAFESALVLAGFFVASTVLARLTDRFGLQSPADPAGLPLVALAAGVVSLLAVPVAHAISRGYERSADRFALNLTNNPSAFISAMRRLGAQNLAEEHPSKLVQWLFYSHPPMRERIASAQTRQR